MAAGYLLFAQVMHQRYRPVVHRFVYPVFCLRLNLAELAGLDNRWFGVDRRRPLSLRTRDYGSRDGSDLLVWIRGVLSDAGLPADGAVWLQTFPRLFGYAFNPVSFWYCHDDAGQLRAVLAEVNNTFGEHHRYLLSATDGGVIASDSVLSCRKLLHVSPFCKVEGGYRFRFIERAGRGFAGIDYHDADGLLIRTSIGGKLAPWTPTNLRRALFGQPLLTLGVIARIHWQALRLWLKRVPFYRKPAPPEPAISHGPEVRP